MKLKRQVHCFILRLKTSGSLQHLILNSSTMELFLIWGVFFLGGGGIISPKTIFLDSQCNNWRFYQDGI